VEVNLNEALFFIIFGPFAMIVLDMVLFMVTIGAATNKTLALMNADDEWVAYTAHFTGLRPVVTSFGLAAQVTAIFDKCMAKLSKASLENALYNVHTLSVANIIPATIGAALTVYLAQKQMNGQIPLSSFVPLVSAIGSFGPTLSEIFTHIFTMGKGYVAILKVATMLNSHTRRKEALREDRKRAERIERFQAKNSNSWDAEAIVIADLSVVYPGRALPVFEPLNVTVEPGQIVAVTNDGGKGARTLLRTISRQLSPAAGFVAYPGRWNVRYLDANPVFFGGDHSQLAAAELKGPAALAEAKKASIGTLDFNVKFGATFKHPNAAVYDVEVYTLLSALGVDTSVIGSTASDYCMGSPESPAKKFTLLGLNANKLSATDRTLLALARALLSSPDVLLLDGALDPLGPAKALRALGVLKDWIAHSGVLALATERTATPAALRAPKTLIVSTKLNEVAAATDNVLCAIAAKRSHSHMNSSRDIARFDIDDGTAVSAGTSSKSTPVSKSSKKSGSSRN
jgi:ABC-type branched-subunit amino acid transport system ATPase component